MNMVMHMLAGNYWCNGVCFLGTCFSACVLELQTLLFKTSFDGTGVTMVEFTLLDSGHSMGVLFRENLAILDWLDRSVVMFLVHLAINSCLSFFVTLLDDLLIHHGGSNLFVNGGVMMTSLLPE